MAAEFVFGDMICYKGSIPLGHDEPIMYLGPCNHSDPRGGPTRWLAGDIDMLSIPEGKIDHKDPAMWQECTHLEPPKGIRVMYDGKDVTDRVQITELRGAVHVTTDLDGPFEIIYEPAP